MKSGLIELTKEPSLLRNIGNEEDCLVDGELFTVTRLRSDSVYLSKKDPFAVSDEYPWYSFTHVRSLKGDALLTIEEMINILQKKEYEIK